MKNQSEINFKSKVQYSTPIVEITEINDVLKTSNQLYKMKADNDVTCNNIFQDN